MAKNRGAEIAKKNEDYNMKYIVKPVMSEKASNLSSEGIYIFEIKRGANKIQVSHDIAKAYGFKPAKVNIINRAGKRVAAKRIAGQRRNKKRAVVFMPADKRLPIFEQK